MSYPYKYESGWHTQDIFGDYYTKTEIDDFLDVFVIPSYAVHPTSPEDGMMYINTVVDSIYIYYGSEWQLLHILFKQFTEGELMGLLCLTYA